MFKMNVTNKPETVMMGGTDVEQQRYVGSAKVQNQYNEWRSEL